jgi:hypothetical protein
VYVPAGVTDAEIVPLAPAQIAVLVTVTTGLGFTVIVPLPEPTQPAALVAVQV